MAGSAVLAFLACAVLGGHENTVSPREINPSASRPAVDALAADNTEAIYVHDKLMQVGTVDAGTPVLRFVECRHYPKEHMKLAQVGLTSAGNAVLRLIAGDRCIFAPDGDVEGADAAGDQSENLRELQRHPGRFSAVELKHAPRNDRLGMYQQYVCEKFGSACQVALAIQLAENPTGACEVYHYNTTDGTLDWGFFQINTVHLTRRGLNLRDLLDCKANIDFAYKLFNEAGFEPWTSYRTGAYLRFLTNRTTQRFALAANRKSIDHQVLRASIDIF
jgi:hypothetical protein